MKNKQISIQEMRSIQLAMLKSIHQFCVANGIRYSLSGGTLIGAVRHQGFIPWDDDIDLMMPRPDYERFVATYQHDYYQVKSYMNDDTYWLPFCKVFDSRTVLVESHIKSGVYLDIFPIDGMPDEETTKKMIERRIKLQFKNIYFASKVYKFKAGNPLLNRLKYAVRRILVPSREKSIKELEDMCTTYSFETSEYAGVLAGGYGINERMPKSVFLKYIDLPFEDLSCKCIADYDTYLTNLYGDYMTLPPIEKRETRHKFIVYWK